MILAEVSGTVTIAVASLALLGTIVTSWFLYRQGSKHDESMAGVGMVEQAFLGTQQTVTTLQADNTSHREEIKDLHKELGELEASHAKENEAWALKVTKLERDNAELHAEINSLKSKVARQGAEINRLKEQA